MSSANKIGKETAHVLAGVALNLHTDTKEAVQRYGNVMQEVYSKIRSALTGRELAHVQYLLKKYREALRDDPTTAAAEGSVGQVCATCVKLARDGRALPESYGEARKLAYPPVERTPRQPAAPAAPEKGASGPEAVPADGKNKIAAASAIIRTMTANELSVISVLVEGLLYAMDARASADALDDEAEAEDGDVSAAPSLAERAPSMRRKPHQKKVA